MSVIDDGLLKFSKLEELVLSANLLTEIAVESLPITLKASLFLNPIDLPLSQLIRETSFNSFLLTHR